jgi:hypothetical protein
MLSAFAAGVDARVDVWTGMPHGYAGSVGKLKAAAQTLDAPWVCFSLSGGRRAPDR